MKLETRIEAFILLGKFTREFVDLQSGKKTNFLPGWHELLQTAVEEAEVLNPWFSRTHILTALDALAMAMQEAELRNWIAKYENAIEGCRERNRVGVIMAGNIPLVGFHDFMCVLISGMHLTAKLSSQDRKLLPAMADILCKIEPGFRNDINFVEARMPEIDAVIATGSNNSFRYFEYYFRDIPQILRRSRTGIAVLTGKETDAELASLADDVFLYYGMGCRNISKVFLPGGFPIERLDKAWEKYAPFINHNKFRNNYDYYKAIYLINRDKFHDTGYLLLKPDPSYASPVSVVYVEEYDNLSDLSLVLKENKDSIQCIVSQAREIDGAIPLGSAQFPGLSDYADGVDTIKFLVER